MLYKLMKRGVMRFFVVLFSLYILLSVTHPAVSGQFGSSFVQFRRQFNEPIIDLFMGHWTNVKPRNMYGDLETWDILTKLEGDPLKPNKKGAVLTDLNSVMYAVLKPSSSTRPVTLKSRQNVFYVVSGEGTIKTKNSTAELMDGIGILMPSNVEYTIHNTGNEPLVMYIIEEPVAEGFVPKKDMVVRYEYDNKISTNIERVDSRNWLFGPDDGLSTLVAFNIVMYEPQSIVPPHIHEPGVEEVWIAVKGDMSLMYGSQRRKFVEGGAYKVPANGITPHANINTSETSKKLIWMMKVPVRNVPVPQQPRRKNGLI